MTNDQNNFKFVKKNLLLKFLGLYFNIIDYSILKMLETQNIVHAKYLDIHCTNVYVRIAKYAIINLHHNVIL